MRIDLLSILVRIFRVFGKGLNSCPVPSDYSTFVEPNFLLMNTPPAVALSVSSQLIPETSNVLLERQSGASHGVYVGNPA